MANSNWKENYIGYSYQFSVQKRSRKAEFYHNCYQSYNLSGLFATVYKSPHHTVCINCQAMPFFFKLKCFGLYKWLLPSCITANANMYVLPPNDYDFAGIFAVTEQIKWAMIVAVMNTIEVVFSWINFQLCWRPRAIQNSRCSLL